MPTRVSAASMAMGRLMAIFCSEGQRMEFSEDQRQRRKSA